MQLYPGEKRKEKEKKKERKRKEKKLQKCIWRTDVMLMIYIYIQLHMITMYNDIFFGFVLLANRNQCAQIGLVWL